MNSHKHITMALVLGAAMTAPLSAKADDLDEQIQGVANVGHEVLSQAPPGSAIRIGYEAIARPVLDSIQSDIRSTTSHDSSDDSGD